MAVLSGRTTLYSAARCVRSCGCRCIESATIDGNYAFIMVSDRNESTMRVRINTV